MERPRRSVTVIAGWTAVAALAISSSWYSRDLENRSDYWAWVTVAAAVVSVGLAAAVVRAARGDTRAGRAPALIVALFVLAVQLVTPHGSQAHCFYAAPHATAGWSHGSV